jgi:hypothetical protein
MLNGIGNKIMNMYELDQYKLGNISLYKLVNTLYDVEKIIEIATDNGKTHKCINMTVITNAYDSDEIINKKLKRMSKHSRIYNFVLMEVKHHPKVETIQHHSLFKVSYFINAFRRVKLKKPNPSGPSTYSIGTLASMLGIPKVYYNSVVHKVCNNGDRYIFNVRPEFFEIDVAGYIEELKVKMRKIVAKNGYYIKIFADIDANLNVIINRKKAFYDGHVPKITKQHIYNILGVNEYLYSECYILPKDNETFFRLHEVKNNPYHLSYSENEIYDKFNMVFGNYYTIEQITTITDSVVLSFIPRNDDKSEFVKWLDETIDKIVPLSIDHYDRIEALKSKAETLEERCARYKPPLYDNGGLNVSQQLTIVNKLLEMPRFL